MLPRPTLEAFDAWLLARRLELEAVVVGGAALVLLGVIERQTRDVDILHPELSEGVVEAAREFASHFRGSGIALSDDWLNNGPIQLAGVLPEGWKHRVQLVFTGKALRLTTLGRTDLQPNCSPFATEVQTWRTVSRWHRQGRNSRKQRLGWRIKTPTRCGRTTFAQRWLIWRGGLLVAFSRSSALGMRPDDSAFTRDMAGIGMNFAARPDPSAPIEETLVHASALGMDDDDLRVLAVLTTWLGVHYARINCDRLVRSVSGHPSERVWAYWAAVAQWLGKDRRFRRLSNFYEGPPLDLLAVGNAFQIARRGEDERFAGSVLRAPAGALRDRPEDVLSREALVRLHPGYRNRVRMGPTWRADVWTVLEADPGLSVAEAARRAGCSFATAWQVMQDFALLQRATGAATPS